MYILVYVYINICTYLSVYLYICIYSNWRKAVQESRFGASHLPLTGPCGDGFHKPLMLMDGDGKHQCLSCTILQ